MLCVVLLSLSALQLVASVNIQEYSAMFTAYSNSGSFQYDGTVGVKPLTKTQQITVALNLTSYLYLGGSKSIYGGVVKSSSAGARCDFDGGYKDLDTWDFSATGGWRLATVTKMGTHTIWTKDCTGVDPCIDCTANPGRATSGSATIEFNGRGYPVTYTNTQYACNITFEHYSSKSSTYFKDSGLWAAPASCYPSVPDPNPINATTLSFYRSFDNDTFARYLENDNVADMDGEAYWGCDSTNSELLFAQFDIEHDARYNTYRLCNKGSCQCYGDLQSCQFVGKKDAGYNGHWLSLPASAQCAKGFPLGTNNCTWSASYKLVHVITMDCFRTIASPNYPNGCSRTSCYRNGNYHDAAEHMLFALENCPDVKDTLPFAP